MLNSGAGSGPRRWRPVVAALAALVAVAACGGGGASTSSGAGQRGVSCANTSINIGTNGDAANINPILAVDLDGRWRSDLMFDPLVQVDPTTLQPRPALATSWDVSSDGRTYTFHLRHGVKFQNGQPFTADDVAFTVDQMLKPSYTGPYQVDWARLAGASDVIHGAASTPSGLQVIDPYTIRMTLTEPYAGFLTVMVRQLKPLPSQYLKDAGVLTPSSAFSLHPFGTGPYRFVSWVKGSAFKVEANPDYWGGTPCMKQITQTIIPDINTLDSALESGQIDASIIPGPAALPQLRQDSSLKVYTLPPLTPEGLYFNLRTEPWKSNAQLRRAVAYAIDFRAFAKQFMAGTSNSPASFLSPASWAYDPKALPPQYDPKKAADLLTQAGYPGGKGLTIDISTNAGNLFRQQEETFVQAELAKVGIKVTLEQHEWGQFITSVIGGKYDVAAVNGGDNAGIPDPTAIDSTYVTGGADNYSGYSNPQVDQLMAQAGSISNVAQRKKLYDQVQQILAQDVPFLPSFWRPNPLVVKASIHGVAPSVTGAYWNIQDWSNR